MDPFQRTSRGSYAFRVVPMTHLARPANNGWVALTKESELSAPPASASNPLRHGLTGFSRVDLHASAEADGGGGDVDNVRKWQQFGLRVEPANGSASSSRSPPPLPSDQPAFLKESDASTLPDGPHSRRCRTATTERSTGVGTSDSTNAASSSLLSRRSGAGRFAIAAAKAAGESAVCSGARATEPTIVEIVDDDGDEDDFHTPPVVSHPLSVGGPLQDQSPSSPTPAAPMPPSLSSGATPAAGCGDTAGADAVRRLQSNLAQLSEKVQHNTEAQRCGPPKRSNNNNNGGGSDVGGGPPSWAAKRWGKSKQKAKEKTGQHDGDEGDNSKANRDSLAAAPDSDVATSAYGGTKGRATRKRGKAATSASGDAAPSRKGGKRKRTEGDGVASNARNNTSRTRTLFSFSTSAAAGDPQNLLAGLQGVPTAAATVAVPFIYLQTSTDDLFDDIRRALNDPDRIQAPPLFVGISTLASNGNGGAPLVECRTNFTYHSSASKAVKGRASSCFFSIDPVYSHQHVELVFARWKDAVYALPAQTLGFPFLCRVLTELPGVELITFNAQAVLVALLAHCKGTLWSHCISDVRVMAWMAQLHIGCSVAPSSRHATAAAEVDSGGGGGGEAEMNVLYDYDQLLLRVSAGKPLPSVLLEKASDGDLNSAGSSFHVPSSSTTETPAPPLTPAQRRLAQQVYYLATVYRSLYGLLGGKGLLQAFLRQEKRIALLLALMRFNGIGVDLPEVHRYQKSCEAEMARQRTLASTLVPEMGDDFNIQSHDQCRRALYEVLKLGRFLTAKTPNGGEAAAGSGLTVTKGGRLSTAEDTLRALAPHHEFPACLLRYRKASKLMQTYVEGMMSYAIVRTEKTGAAAASKAGSPARAVSGEQPAPQLLGETVDGGDAGSPFIDRLLNVGAEAMASPTNVSARPSADEEASMTAVGDLTLPGRGYATIHPNFLQEGTDTGRLSCVEPNLQNLPRNGATHMPSAGAEGEEREEDLLGFRRCFVAPPGSLLLSVDYQQIELRVLAHLCGDKALIDALTKSTDIHRAIAEVIFKKKSVSDEERTLAKRVVFGMLYGAGPKTLAAHMGVNVERALSITSLLTSAFPGIETYHRRVIEESRVNGFVRTISGRLRYLPDIQSTVMSRRSYAERQAFNGVVQGSAADVMKMAMLAVARDVLHRYSRDDVCLVSQIHDEMVFTVRKELLPSVVPVVSAAMSQAMHLLVPLSVTVKFGHSLGELQEWSVEHDLGLGVGD